MRPVTAEANRAIVRHSLSDGSFPASATVFPAWLDEQLGLQGTPRDATRSDSHGAHSHNHSAKEVQRSPILGEDVEKGGGAAGEE